jgi:hypothetical protein
MTHLGAEADVAVRHSAALRLAVVVVAAAIAFWPVTIQLLGSDVSCGGAAVAFGRSVAAHLGAQPGASIPVATQQCGAVAWPRLVVALLAGVGGLAVAWRLAPRSSRGKSFRLTRS